MKLILFDCDETLWTSEGRDYISSVKSELIRESAGVVVRVKDKKKFILKPEVTNTFQYLLQYFPQAYIGIVSDNDPIPVIEALELLGLIHFIHPDAINVKLWKGHCPKEVMIEEILAKPIFCKIKPSNVYLLDDKDYSEALKKKNMHFIQVDGSKSLIDLIVPLLNAQSSSN